MFCVGETGNVSGETCWIWLISSFEMAFENGPFSESFLSAYCVVLLKRLPQSNDVNILFRFLIVGPVMGCLVFQCGRYLRRKLRLKTSHFCDYSRILAVFII